MLLNADILFENLADSVQMDRFGMSDEALSLRRPVFWFRGLQRMEPHGVYLARTADLPAVPCFLKGDLVICFGGNPPASYRGRDFSCFVVVDDTDIMTFSNIVGGIYDRYDAWELQMLRLLEDGADLQEMVDCTSMVIDNPLYILDNDYHYLAYSGIINELDSLKHLRPDQVYTLDLSVLTDYLKEYGTSNMTRTDCFLSKAPEAEEQVYTKNLIDSETGRYAGSMNMQLVFTGSDPGGLAIARVFFGYAERAYWKTSRTLSGGNRHLKDIFADLLNCYPIIPLHQQYLRDHMNGDYVCLVGEPGHQLRNVAHEYLCMQVEDLFPGCISFPFSMAIVIIANLKEIGGDAVSFARRLQEALNVWDVRIGISSAFDDLLLARQYYREACIASEVGSSLHPEENLFVFDEQLLPYMLLNSSGEFSVEFIAEKVLGPLLEHDTKTDVSYIETLRAYYDNNLVMLKTAKGLYIHRTTLAARIASIEKLLGRDLSDPDTHLLISLLLKILEISDGARGGKGPSRAG